MIAITKFRRFNRLVAVVSIVVLIILSVPIAILLRRPSTVAQAAWYDDNWDYRKSFTITNNATVTDQQVSIANVDTATLVTNGQMLTSCGDSRWTDAGGLILQYAITSGCNTSNTTYAVRVPTINNGNTTLYHYYGNPAAADGFLSTLGVPSCSTCTVAAGSVENSPGPTSYWRFDEGYGSSGRDATSQANTLTIASGSWQPDASCISGSCLFFDGTNTKATRTGSSTATTTYNPAAASDDGADVTGNNTFRTEGSCDNGWGAGSKLMATGGQTGSACDTAGLAITGGIRFTNVTIPQGSVVSSATFDLNNNYGGGYGTNVKNTIYGSLTANLSTFSGSNLPRNVTKTSASATWNSNGGSAPADTWFSATAEVPPSVTAIIQEIVNQGAWASGNALGLIFADNGSTDDWWFEYHPYENGSSTYPKLTVAYATGTDIEPELSPGTGSFSLSAWVRHTSSVAGTDTILARFLTKGYKLYMNSSGNICFGIDDDSTSFPEDSACSASSYADSQWHYVAAVKSGTSSITLYIDGVSVAQDAAISATGTLASYGDFVVGADSDSTNFWTGYIDEVKYYNFARSSAQVASDFAARGTTKGISAQFGPDTNKSLSSGLLGYWKFDETSGNATDSSGNGSTLTNNGTTTFSTGKFSMATNHNGTTQYFSTATAIAGIQTVAFWVNTANASDDYINLIASTAYINSSSGIVSASGFTNPLVYVNGILNGALTASVWNHVVVTTTSAISATAFEVGRANGAYLDNTGKMDDVRIYNRALSSKEVEALANWAPGPAAWWKMDDNSGTTRAVDASGNSYNGTLSNMVGTWVPGKYGSALTFDGSNDYMDANTSITGNGSSSFSYTGWVNVTSGTRPSYNYQSFIANRETTTGGCTADAGLGVQYTAANTFTTVFQIGQHTGASCGLETSATGSSLSTNTWYFLAGTFDISTKAMKLYLNGVQDGTATWGGTGNITWFDTTHFYVGAGDNGNSFLPGIVDDVRVYTYVRTPKQIVQDMNAGHPAVGSPISSPIIYWKFDEATGTTVNNSNPLYPSLTGTISGPTWTIPETCKINFCVGFGPASDFISAGDTSFTDSLTGMTLSLWMNAGYTTDDTIVSKSNLSNQNSFLVRTDSSSAGEIRVYISSSLSDTSNYFLTSNLDLVTNCSNSFCHIAIVYDGTAGASDRVKVYRNGLLISGSVTGTIPTSMTSGSTSNLTIGDSDIAGTEGISSLFADEFKIYDYALTTSEVLVDMNAGSSSAMGGVLRNQNTQNNEGFNVNSPVAWWKMDENTGTSSTFDTSSYNYTGTLTNVVNSDWRPGKFGSALNLDGSSSYVTATTEDANFSIDSYSLEAWIKRRTDSGAAEIIIDNRDAASDGQLMQINASDNIECYYNATSSVSTTAIATNTWYYIVCTSDASTQRLYINGIQEDSDAISGSIAEATDISLGARSFTSPTSYFPGILDDVRVYDYTRSAADVVYDYSRGAPVAWYKFDECQGGTTYNAVLNANGDAAGMNGAITIGTSGSQNATGSCTGNSTDAWKNGATGKYTASLNFDGTDDVATVTNASAIDLNEGLQNGLTISAWVYPTGSGEGSAGEIFRKTATTFCRLGGSTPFNLTCNLDLSTDATLTVNAVLPVNTWSHVALTWTDDSDDEIILWVNGIAVGSSIDGVGPTSADSSNLLIGGGASNNFAGQIDQFQVYNYEMTAAQIRRLYNEGFAQRFGPVSGSP